jgi:hypothetical protein
MFVSYTGLIKRAKNPAADAYNQSDDDNLFGFDSEFKAYLYWPLAVVMVAVSVASYLVGMYFAS